MQLAADTRVDQQQTPLLKKQVQNFKRTAFNSENGYQQHSPRQSLARSSVSSAVEQPSKDVDLESPRSTYGVDGCPDNIGFSRDLDLYFKMGKELGKGGSGVVCIVTEKKTGKEYACKSIPKRLPGADDEKNKKRIESINREVVALQRLRGVLNVVEFEQVFEDDEYVHIVMEYCRGGELYHRTGERHYSERTVASFMRAILRTIAQCHAKKIIHRDIKPGNFMLLDKGEKSRTKAVDFGLAIPFKDKDLPISDADLQGTPWFMAPEQLSSQITPAIDIWAAGVTAHQLLTGRFPFDDRRNPYNPALSAVWRSILTDQLNLNRNYWEGISKEAKDFVAQCLDKDPKKRPSATQLLNHPWLKGDISERCEGRALGLQVVAKLQRFAQASQLKRGVLQLMARELVEKLRQEARNKRACPIDTEARPLVYAPNDDVMQYIYQSMKLEGREMLSAQELTQGLKRLGHKVSTAEVERMMRLLDPNMSGHLPASDFAATQIDWAHVQETYKDTWLELARNAFEKLDTEQSGFVTWRQLLYALKCKVDPYEMQAAVKHTLAEAGQEDADQLTGGLTFETFCRMLEVTPSEQDLTLYDDGASMGESVGSCGALSAMLERSKHGGTDALECLKEVS